MGLILKWLLSVLKKPADASYLYDLKMPKSLLIHLIKC